MIAPDVTIATLVKEERTLKSAPLIPARVAVRCYYSENEITKYFGIHEIFITKD